MDFIKKKKAFTLVELIIVITILAILSTIAFISFQSYFQDSRDSNRLVTLKNISEGLTLHNVKVWEYPNPEGKISSGVIQNNILFYQWELWENISHLLNFNSHPTDPATSNNYIYATDTSKRYYQVATILESQVAYHHLIPITYASNFTAKVEWNYPGYIKFSSGSERRIANIPGIIYNNTGTIDLLSTWVYYVVDKWKNLPYKYNNVSIQNTPPNQIIKELMLSQNATLTGINITGINDTNFWTYFSGATLESFNIWKINITDTPNLIQSVKKIVLGNSYVAPNIAIPNTPLIDTNISSNSLMLDGTQNQYLSRTQSGWSLKKQFTISTWVKKTKLWQNQMIAQAFYDGVNFIQFWFDNQDHLMIYSIQAGTDYWYVYTPQYRDTWAWMHIVFTVDTENTIGTERFRLYVNNQRITSTVGNYWEPPLNYVTDFFNPGFQHTLARNIDQSTYYHWYLADTHMIDGQALTPTDFGYSEPTTAQWLPKKYTGTYWINGFYLDFSDGTNLWKDKIGTNNWTLNGWITQANNQMIDNPTNNFATMNPLANTQTITAWNLKVYGSSNTATHGSIAIPSNVPTYFEVTNMVQTHANLAFWCGIVGSTLSPTLNYQVSSIPRMAGFYSSNYQYVMKDDGTYTQVAASPLLANDIIKIAVNGNNMWVGKNTVWYDAAWGTTGNPATWANPTTTLDATTTYLPYVHLYLNTAKVNFWQSTFAYTPPTWYKALSTKNLPDPVIKKPNEHFDVVTYTGNGGVLNINWLAFQPDFVWFKNRTVASQNTLIDSVRWVSKQLFSNLTNSEQTSVTGLSSFNSDGLTLNGNVNPTWDINFATHSYVAWNWKAGGAPVSNWNGTITSQVSANPTAWFSIITYTWNGVNGATVWHGLSKQPELILEKWRETAQYWTAQAWWAWPWSVSGYTGRQNTLFLNGNHSVNANSWNGAPTSTIYKPSALNYQNENTKTYVAYAFHSVEGYSKIWTYTGNGSADGPFLYTGFKPRYIMIKKMNSTSNWSIFDTARDTDNVVDLWLWANVSNSELTSPAAQTFDFLSSGIKIRGIWDDSNVSGATYIYATFAESPFKYSNAR